MTRIRLVFVLLAVALLVPGVFLVRRALESVEVERAARHRTVAERVFDEMERFLSDFLVAEEARPVGHYRHAWSPAGTPPGVLLRSPLADPPERPFVVGYFEIDGDGRIHTPLQPRGSDGPAGWPEPTDTARAAAERLRQLVAEAWPQTPAPTTTAEVPPEAPPVPETVAQQPGTTVAVGKSGEKEVANRQQEPSVVAEAYDAIQSLNRGAKLRSNRSQKVLPAEAPYVAQREIQIARADTPERKDRGRALGAASAPSSLEVQPRAGQELQENALSDPRSRADAWTGERLAAEALSDASPSTASPTFAAEAEAEAEAAAEAELDELRADDLGQVDLDRGFASAARPGPRADTFASAPTPAGEGSAATATEEGLIGRLQPKTEARLPAVPVAPDPKAALARNERAAKRVAPAAAPPSAARRPSIDSSGKNAQPSAAMGPVVIDPMLGFDLGGGHLVLHRTVWRGPRAFRQGLILDVAALEANLLEAAFPSQAIPGARARIGVGDQLPLSSGPAAYGYRHRFAEPFDALSVDLALPQLAGTGGARTILLLSLALLLTGSVGLFALYRMVAVVVGFSERRSNFVAAVSHELKTPLTSIRMYAEMLRDGIVAGDDKRQEYYGTITAESERLSRLIDNVLEFSRLERGTREMSWSVGDLGAVAREAVAVLTPHAEAQGFSLEVELEPGLPPVRFDRDAVLQVVFNLVDNALKYARDARDKRIVVACAREGSGVSLNVRDCGPGVAGEHLKRIFEPFYRGESELTRRAQGTGIGLSLVRGLADEMGARLRAQNRSEGGLEVRLSFQAASGAQAN